MSWCAVDVRTPAGERERVAMWLVERTGAAVEERSDGVLVSVVPSEPEAAALVAELTIAFRGGETSGTPRPLPEVDWRTEWRSGLGPRRIGRVVVAQSWANRANRADGADAQRVVVIDPETAFGTAEHGSTRAALLLLDRHLQPGDRVLDLGSGSGILAIAAVKLGAARAIGIEIDPEVESIALANAERNGVSDAVGFLTGDARTLLPLLGPAEVIVANILRSQNEVLLPAVRAALAPGGRAVFAGMELSERGRFLAALEQEHFVVCDEAEDEGWWGVTTVSVSDGAGVRE